MTPARQAAEKLMFLIHLWLKEDHGCTCSECKELLEDAEELLKEPQCPFPQPQ